MRWLTTVLVCGLFLISCEATGSPAPAPAPPTRPQYKSDAAKQAERGKVPFKSSKPHPDAASANRIVYTPKAIYQNHDEIRIKEEEEYSQHVHFGEKVPHTENADSIPPEHAHHYLPDTHTITNAGQPRLNLYPWWFDHPEYHPEHNPMPHLRNNSEPLPKQENPKHGEPGHQHEDGDEYFYDPKFTNRPAIIHPDVNATAMLHHTRIDWVGECGCTGFEAESVTTTVALHRNYGLPHLRLAECSASYPRCEGYPSYTEETLEHLLSDHVGDHGEQEPEYRTGPEMIQGLFLRDHPPAIRLPIPQILIIHRQRLGSCGIPSEYHDMATHNHLYHENNPYIISRSMHDEDRIDVAAQHRCNLKFQEIWVPSQFNMNSYLAAGVDAHLLRVMPIGIDTNLYNPETTHARRLFPKQLDDGTPTFTFLSVFRWEDKKNWRGLLSAFYEEFHNEPHVKLWIQTNTYKRATPLYDALNHLHIFGDDDAREIFESRVMMITEKFRVDEMPGLYAGANAFILPSHSEGWGLPYMEAMAMGIPTIGTQFGGALQYMNTNNSYLIPPSSPASSMAKKKKRWAYPRVEHIRQVMRHVMEHPEEARARAQQASIDIRTKYSMDAVAKLIYERMLEIAVQIKTIHNHPDIHDPVDDRHRYDKDEL